MPALFDRKAGGSAAPFLPTSRGEMERLGWDACDVVLIGGDAYVDHPSFGLAVIGRVLEADGFRVGIIAQPDWTSAEPFKALGRPRLFFGVTGGAMDSMVNHYTADRRLRHDDAYTPGGIAGRRPDRAVLVYAQRCREAFKDVPIVLGGIEASLRRVAHFDIWSEKVRRSVLLDAKADLLVYGNGERAILAIARRAARGEPIRAMGDLRGTVTLRDRVPDDWRECDLSGLDAALPPPDSDDVRPEVVRLPSFEAVRDDPVLYAHATRLLHLETNPLNARALVQRHGDKEVWVSPPPLPLSSADLDRVHELPYARAPHPGQGDGKIPAWEMIRFSVAIVRGCFGGCSFCAIAAHEGRIVQSRSADSVLREIAAIRDRTPGFTGAISDLGGPTANMWRLGCTKPQAQARCRRPSCLTPRPCPSLGTDHGPLIALYRAARAVTGVHSVAVASGVRHDLALASPDYIDELTRHHVGGTLKLAPEHSEPGPLALMLKPPIEQFERFRTRFEATARKAGKKLRLIPYFIAAHPGTTDQDMLALALWLKRNGFRLDQVQTFLPSPLTLATAMYHSGRNPLEQVKREGATVFTAKGLRQRRLHKAFLRWHDPENWPILREALHQMGRADLIGGGPNALVPRAAARAENAPVKRGPPPRGKRPRPS
ncbi:YgiQ family radical SAM protein [Phaeospirillum tilakii]|uniref:YgiQ family radical SAM protein n=1 Tax=Phaeospirillum tilakii TaxID=741673 RepID=A0ABW5CCW5_9PROT